MATFFELNLVTTQLACVEEALLVERGWTQEQRACERDLWKKEIDGETFMVSRSTALALERFQEEFRNSLFAATSATSAFYKSVN